MRKKNLFILVILFVASVAFVSPHSAALAQNNDANNPITTYDNGTPSPTAPVAPTLRPQINTSVGNLFKSSGYQTTGPAGNISSVIGYIISGLLLMVGSIFMIIIIYSGIRWMLAGGNKETVEQARTRIVRAAIGLSIVLGAWIITRFVLTGLLNPSRGTGSWFSRQP